MRPPPTADTSSGRIGTTLDPLLSDYHVADGHFDELQDGDRQLRPSWDRFAGAGGDLSREAFSAAARHVAHQIHENGVTYNVYDETAASRPWSLDILPALIDENDWSTIERGVRQRARLLNAVAADLYGPRELLRRRLIPSGLVLANPGFLRACDGIRPPGGTFLHVVAFDLAHGADGRWHIAATRLQAPSGLGYALENRAVISRLFPDAARTLGARPLTPFFDAIQNALLAHAPTGDDAPVAVLLTPGRFSETYFEHVYLARELGLPLVEGGDLTVRDNRVLLKTVSGLRPIHAIWRRVDDDYCDPLELRSDSTLGVPGLLQAWRTGHVVVANAFGMGVLESSALATFLPDVARHLLGEALALTDVPPDADALSHAPVWLDDTVVSRAVDVRVFLLADGHGDYQVMPGGLCRVAGDDRRRVASRDGGSSKDTWILSSSHIDMASSDQDRPPAPVSSHERTTSSRAAEALFWLGRYAERSENTARLLRSALGRFAGATSRSPVWQTLLLRACFRQGLLLVSDLPEELTTDSSDAGTDHIPAVDVAALEAALVDGIHDREKRRSLRFNVEATVRVAESVRDRLSSDNWRVLGRLAALVSVPPSNRPDVNDTLEVLDDVILALVAAAGLEMAHMTRDDGWRFLSLGRHLERLSFVGATLHAVGAEGATDDPTALEWLLDLSDCLITYRSRHLRRPEWPAVVDLLLLDGRNPRSAMFQVAKLEKHVRLLPDAAFTEILAEIARMTRAAEGGHAGQGRLFGRADPLESLAGSCQRLAVALSDALTLRYFSHVYDRPHAVTAR